MTPVRYREHPVPAALRPWVAAVWEVRATADAPGHRILPDGCMDIVRSAGGELRVVGVNTTAFVSSLTAGEVAWGWGMHPGGGARLLGCDAEGLRDARPALRDVWGDAGARVEDRAQSGLAARLQAVAARATAAPAPD